MSDTKHPPEFVAAEAWKVIVRPQSQTGSHGETGRQPASGDTAEDDPSTQFWEAAWTAK